MALFLSPIYFFCLWNIATFISRSDDEKLVNYCNYQEVQIKDITLLLSQPSSQSHLILRKVERLQIRNFGNYISKIVQFVNTVVTQVQTSQLKRENNY